MTAPVSTPLNAYDPEASDGLSFWEKLEYGDTATGAEKMERCQVVTQLLECHRRLVLMVHPSSMFMLVNEACGDLLESIGKILHIDPKEAQRNLLDISIEERDRRIWEYVKKARP